MDHGLWTMDYGPLTMVQKKGPDRHRGRLLYNAHEKKTKLIQLN